MILASAGGLRIVAGDSRARLSGLIAYLALLVLKKGIREPGRRHMPCYGIHGLSFSRILKSQQPGAPSPLCVIDGLPQFGRV